MAGLEVGSVFTRLGFRVDESGATRYESRRRRLQEQSRQEIVTRAGVKADTRGFDHYNAGAAQATHHTGELDKTMHGAEGRLGKYAIGMRAVGGALLGGAGAFGLVEGLKAAIDREGELQKTEARTQSALRSTHGQANVTAKGIEELANRLGNMAGVDHEVVQGSENTLLAFTKVRNEAGKNNDIFNQATKAALNLSVATGRDATSAATMLGKALQDPVKGLGLLSRIGVQFDDQTKNHIKTLVAHGHQLEAQKIVLEQVTTRFGGAAAAAGKTMPAALNRMKVAVMDGFGALGKVAAPALTGAANWMGKFIKGLQDGRGAGGAFAKDAKAAFSAVGAVVRSVAGFINKVINENRVTLHAIGAEMGKLWTTAKLAFNGILAAARSVFGSGGSGGIGKDIRTIISVLLVLERAWLSLLNSVVRRALPGIIAAFKGFFQVVKGIVEVLTGLLTLNFSKAWQGVKDIFSGAIKAILGALRAATAPFREIASRAGGAIVDALGSALHAVTSTVSGAFNGALHFLEGLPGQFFGIGKRMVGALASGLAGIGHAIIGALSAGGGFIGDIGRKIADWINANTPFGDNIKLGPIHVHIPALAAGGRVGPSRGGPRVFIAGEGNADEWVISQEGDRNRNVAWAREALEALTGRSVELHAAGKGARHKLKKPPIKPTLPAGTNAGIKRSVARGESGIKNFDRDIQRMERRYDQLDREYGMSDEVIVIENDDGSATLDQGAEDKRLGELGSLHSYREKIQQKIVDYRNNVLALIKTYTTAITRLTRAINAAKGKARGKERAKYLSERQGYQQRVGELQDVAADLLLDGEDQRLDLEELDNEIGAVRGSAGRPAPASTDTGGTGDTGTTGTGGTGDTGTGDTGTGDTGTTAPPTAEQIAAAAIADLQAFQSARQDLFSSFGGNAMSAGGLAALLGGAGTLSAQAAGLRYFGAVPPEGGITVNVNNNYGSAPSDPATWAAQQRFHVEAAMG